MDSSIPSPKPLTLVPGYARNEATNITIHCHDRTFKSVDVLDDASGETLFKVESKGASSLTWRRTILSASGTKLFDLRHMGYAMKNDWAVEDPQGKRICSLRHVSGMTARNRSNLDAVVHGECEADDVGNVVEIRPKDRGALSTSVLFQGRELATIANVEANDVRGLEKKGLDRTVWKASVNAGVDISLILVAVLCLAEMEHVWRQ
ncbi:hypothetical protein E4T52_08036 [Aureobasidium sp. EXF-3400]|nr:hypothetical protein E4T51_03677 [Aureobasidium sp. EXF-12344]KAI4777035.1 hypothetical protein E4T52_08036 [Aureobasidium sp. EXF-3400]